MRLACIFDFILDYGILFHIVTKGFCEVFFHPRKRHVRAVGCEFRELPAYE